MHECECSMDIPSAVDYVYRASSCDPEVKLPCLSYIPIPVFIKIARSTLSARLRDLSGQENPVQIVSPAGNVREPSCP